MRGFYKKLDVTAGLFVVLSLSACNFASPDKESMKSPEVAGSTNIDAFASHDDATDLPAQDIERPVMQAQVLLDRLGFAPGVIDNEMGQSTQNAIRGFQEANRLSVSGKLDDPTRKAILTKLSLPATRMVTIPQNFADQTFVAIPVDAEGKAKLQSLGYENILEALAERFHTTPDTLRVLNGVSATAHGDAPAAAETSKAESGTETSKTTAASNTEAEVFAAGKEIRVPNVGGDIMLASSAEQADADWDKTLRMLGVSDKQPSASEIVVDESEGVLRALDENGKLLVQFTATMGSEHDPLPIGTWKVNGVAHNPPFTYNPKLFWDVADSKPKLQFKPGPNSPVGVVWIDLNKEHYGIHGTPAPETIGRAESHGCVRLTNWDAARLAGMVKPGTKIIFQK